MTEVAMLGAAVAALGLGYISFIVRRADKRLEQFESLFISMAEMKARVEANTSSITELRAEAGTVRSMLTNIREDIAFIKASLR